MQFGHAPRTAAAGRRPGWRARSLRRIRDGFGPLHPASGGGRARSASADWATSISSAMPRLAGLTEWENSSELSLHALPNRQRPAQCQICRTRNDREVHRRRCAQPSPPRLASIAAAQAAECPRKDALGTSRVLTVDAATYAARRPEELSADAAAGRSRGGADLRRRAVAGDDAEGAGGAGAGMRARHLLPDRQAGLRTPRHWCEGSRREGHTIGHHTWTHPQSQIHEAGRGRRRDRQGHRGGRDGASRGRDHDPEHAVLPLSLLRNRRQPRSTAAKARHRRVRRRPLGQRLEPDDAGSRN